LVPCIVEGRSELRNVSRVNCKTQWLIYELRITLLTERISHFVVVHFRTLQCAWLSARCFIIQILYLKQCASAQARLRAEFKHISKRSAKTETNQDTLSNGE